MFEEPISRAGVLQQLEKEEDLEGHRAFVCQTLNIEDGKRNRRKKLEARRRLLRKERFRDVRQMEHPNTVDIESRLNDMIAEKKVDREWFLQLSHGEHILTHWDNPKIFSLLVQVALSCNLEAMGWFGTIPSLMTWTNVLPSLPTIFDNFDLSPTFRIFALQVLCTVASEIRAEKGEQCKMPFITEGLVDAIVRCEDNNMNFNELATRTLGLCIFNGDLGNACVLQALRYIGRLIRNDETTLQTSSRLTVYREFLRTYREDKDNENEMYRAFIAADCHFDIKKQLTGKTKNHVSSALACLLRLIESNDPEVIQALQLIDILDNLSFLDKHGSSLQKQRIKKLVKALTAKPETKAGATKEDMLLNSELMLSGLGF